MDMEKLIHGIKMPTGPSCETDKRWCIQGIFIPGGNKEWQLIYHRGMVDLAAFAGIVFDYCPMCGRKLT
jgi:hypothetical protein